MSDAPKQYWFPAKRYGWGWGAPNVWQGWVVLIAWAAALAVGAALMISHGLPVYLLFICGMSAILIAICFAKGEPPRWRWGNK